MYFEALVLFIIITCLFLPLFLTVYCGILFMLFDVLIVWRRDFSASSKASSKELERIDSLFYAYANGSSGSIE